MSSNIFDQTKALRPEQLILELPIVVPHTLPSNEQTEKQNLLNIISWEYQPLPDPFTLSFNQFLQLSYAEVAELQDEVYKKFSKSLEDAWKAFKKGVPVSKSELIFVNAVLSSILASSDFSSPM